MHHDVDRKADDEYVANYLLIFWINDEICKAIQGVNDQNAAHFIEYLEPLDQTIIERPPCDQIGIRNQRKQELQSQL